MEAVTLTIMRIQQERGLFNKMESLRETATPLILDSPTEHIPLYPDMWEAELRMKMEYWRIDY